MGCAVWKKKGTVTLKLEGVFMKQEQLDLEWGIKREVAVCSVHRSIHSAPKAWS